MNVDEASQTHDWVRGVDLPWCRVCGLSQISAHIIGDDEWTREPIPCPGEPHDSEEARWMLLHRVLGGQVNIDEMPADREMDALVKVWGLVPKDEAPAKTEMERLRQRIADALARAQAAMPTINFGREIKLAAQGIQAGTIATLEKVLDCIDEIVAEGKEDEHSLTPD